MADIEHPSTTTLQEADRLMTICNACRYCEGLCAVFPAMELRKTFSAGDLNYLANLCHGCGACLIGRDWYALSDWRLTDDGRCRRCDTPCAGVFAGPPGNWGRRRQPVRLANFAA